VADKAWKEMERIAADLIGGRRFWSNSGEALDIEGPTYVGQVKLVRRCPLEQLTQLVEMVERQARVKHKNGVVAIKVRRGRGKPSPVLMVVSADTWERMHRAASFFCPEVSPPPPPAASVNSPVLPVDIAVDNLPLRLEA
jgi:hypothetical protein